MRLSILQAEVFDGQQREVSHIKEPVALDPIEQCERRESITLMGWRLVVVDLDSLPCSPIPWYRA